MGPLTRRRLVTSALALFGATAVAHPSVTTDRLTGADAPPAGGSGDTASTLVVADADQIHGSDDESEAGPDGRLFEIPVEEGDEVTLAYTHSVEKTPVEDVYVVDDGELRAERMVFHSFGAGLPTENVERTEEGYVVEGEGTYEELHVNPGSIAGHELVVGGDRYDLVAAADGGVVVFLTGREADRREASGETSGEIASREAERPGEPGIDRLIAHA